MSVAFAVNMRNDDVLGDDGRQALKACVKVKICGEPETRRYDGETAENRLRGCYSGCNPVGNFWLGKVFDRHSSYNIVDIHDALVNFDKRKSIEKYPKEGPKSIKQRDLIDKRRADVKRELEEATANPDGRLRYSWLAAQRRVRDCFAGNFTEDRWMLLNGDDSWRYSIKDIGNAFLYWEKVRKRAEAQRTATEEEYVKAKSKTADDKLSEYSKSDAAMRVMDAQLRFGERPLNEDDVLPVKTDASRVRAQNYDIFDIYKASVKFDGKRLEKYPEEGPGSDDLKQLIDEHRTELEEEYQKTCKSGMGYWYSSWEADRRVRDCFSGTFPSDTKIFTKKEKDESDQTYDIFDIKKAIDHFDAQTFLDVCKYASKGEPECDKINQRVDKERASIQEEYDEATTYVVIEHGSGFVIHDHFILTNKHVIEAHLNESKRYEICISNAEIEGLSCKVAHHDAGKDLALLYCPDLNLERCGIYPLQLSKQTLSPGMSIFTFGYPVSHTEETALFVSGNVSGSKRTLAGYSMIVLNCSLNFGNSGGPVLRWVNGKLKVVGVATQKHFKEILTLEEMQTIENIRESLQTHAITDVPGYIKQSNRPEIESDYYLSPRTHQTPMTLLTLKLYDALETHSQFNLSNAVPGHLVVEFVKNCISEYSGEHKEELFKVVELAKDHVNILPSGHLSASQCCIQ